MIELKGLVVKLLSSFFINLNSKLNNILYIECNPYLYVLTINKILNFPRRKYSKIGYLNKYLNVLGISLTGDYYFAWQYIKAIIEEAEKCKEYILTYASHTFFARKCEEGEEKIEGY